MSSMLIGDINRVNDSTSEKDIERLLKYLIHTTMGSVALLNQFIEKLMDNNYFNIYLYVLNFINKNPINGNISLVIVKTALIEIPIQKQKLEELSEYVFLNGSDIQKDLFFNIANNNDKVIEIAKKYKYNSLHFYAEEYDSEQEPDSEEEMEPEPDSEEEQSDYYYPESESDEDVSLSECDYFSTNSNINPNTKKKFKSLEEFTEYKTKCDSSADIPYYLCNRLTSDNPSSCGYKIPVNKKPETLFTSKRDDFIVCSDTNKDDEKEYFESYPGCTTSETNNWKEINEWMKAQKKYMDSLSFDEKYILLSYNGVSNSDAQSFDWNSILRGDGKVEPQSAYSIIDSIELFYRIILNAPRTPNMLVFRGDSVQPDNNYLRKKQLENKAFISTSLDVNVAIKYSSGESDDYQESWGRPTNSAVSQIQLPYGTPAIFIGGVNYPSVDERFEIVLLPNMFNYEGYYEKYESPLNKSLISKNSRHPEFYCWIYDNTLPLVDLLHYCVDEPLKLTNEEVLKNFINYFNKFWKKQDSNNPFIWITKGGYGYNLLLENKYSTKNLTPTHDLDLGVYYDTNKVSEIDVNNLHRNLKVEINNWISSLPDIVKNSIIIDGRSDDNLEIIFIKYKYCDEVEEGIIDISLIGIEGGFPFELIDTKLSEKVKLPVKTEFGYLEELKGLFFRENILGLDEHTYDVRNMFRGSSKEKGIKTIKRISNLCESMLDYDTHLIDNRGRTVYDYGKLCGLFVDLTLNGLEALGEQEMTKLSERLREDKPIASFYMKSMILKSIREKKDKQKVKEFLKKNPNWIWKQTDETINNIIEFFSEDILVDKDDWIQQSLKERLVKDRNFVNSLTKSKLQTILKLIRHSFNDLTFIREWTKIMIKRNKEWLWNLDALSREYILDAFIDSSKDDIEWIGKIIERKHKETGNVFDLVYIQKLMNYSDKKWFKDYLNNLFENDFNKLMEMPINIVKNLFLEKIKNLMIKNPLWFFKKSTSNILSIIDLFKYSTSEDKMWIYNWINNKKEDSQYSFYVDMMYRTDRNDRIKNKLMYLF